MITIKICIHWFWAQFTENEANIEGTNIVDHGDEINLRCTVIIRSPIENAPIVRWYLNNTVVSFGPGQRKQIEMKWSLLYPSQSIQCHTVENSLSLAYSKYAYLAFVQRTNDSQLNHIVDELTILYANQSYAGTYTCIAENSSPKSIIVTVNCE